MPFPIGVHYSYRDSLYKPVVLKSDAIKVYIERDGMTEEEADEFWEYNMAGTDSYVIAVDDMLSQDDIAEIIQNE